MREFKVIAKEKTTEIMFYDIVGYDSWSGEGVPAGKFREAVKAVKTPEIDLRLHSPGGDVFDAVTMVAAMDGFKGKINVFVDGLAASAASVLAMAGDRITMAEGSRMMIHDPWSFVGGNADEMRRKASLLDGVKEDIVKAYLRQSNLDAGKIAKLMTEETWMTGDEAVRDGFAHEVNGVSRVTNFAGISRFGYRNAPQMQAPKHTPEQLEEHRKRIEWLEKEAA